MKREHNIINTLKGPSIQDSFSRIRRKMEAASSSPVYLRYKDITGKSYQVPLIISNKKNTEK